MSNTWSASLAFVGAIFIPALSVPASALTVRVDSRGGAPCLVVNGHPVRARMFFGGPGSTPIRVGPVGREVSFEFNAENSADHSGTIHFRFGQVPGDVFLDNFRITDMAAGTDVAPAADFESGPGAFTRDWAFWPSGAKNTVGSVAVEPGVGAGGSAGLHISLHAPPGGEWPDWHVYHLPNLTLARGRRYRVSIKS